MPVKDVLLRFWASPLSWIPAFAGMTKAFMGMLCVIPAKAGIQRASVAKETSQTYGV
jgi:hypothetical protein